MKLNIKTSYVLLIIWIFFFLLVGNSSITGSQQKNDVLTVEEKAAIISKIEEVFIEYYPLFEVAEKMVKFINQKQKKGEYDQFTDLGEFTSQLTRDLRSISKDWHIKVWPYEKIPEDLLEEIKLGTPQDNYGFQKVEVLPCNIGYIHLTSFINPITAGPTANAAMSFVRNCHVLIIDLRKNGGGDESMARLLSSYFFDKSTHLTDVYIRKDAKTKQVWTQDWVPGPRMTEIPVYILLSRYSYSSAEAFSYQLQQLGRAVIIGEKTRGGAHAVRYMSFKNLSINLKVPYTSDINPYSNTNYINGITPDIAVPADQAFSVANIQAAKRLLETETDEKKRYKLKWVLSGYETDLKPVVPDETSLIEFCGIYGNNKVLVECGRLYHQWKDNSRHELVPMGNDLFKYREPDEAHYRIKFLRDKTGSVFEFYEHDSDGDKYPGKKKTGK